MTFAWSKDVALLVGGRIAAVLIGLVSVRLSTHMLSPQEMGKLSVFIVFSSGVGLLLVNPVGQYINRHTHSWFDDGSLAPILGRYNQYLVLVSLTGAAAFILWATWRSWGMSALLVGGAVLALYVYASTWQGTYVAIFNMLGARRTFVFLSTLNALLMLVAAALATKEFGGGLIWFSGLAIGATLAALLARHSMGSFFVDAAGEQAIGRRTSSRLNTKELAQYAGPILLASGLLWVTTSGYRLLIEYGWGMRELGYLAVALGVAGQMWALFESLIIQLVFPYYYRDLNAPARRPLAFQRLAGACLPLYILFFGFSLSISGWLLSVLTDAQYHEAYRFAMFGVVFEFSRATANLLGQYAQVEKKTSMLVIPALLSSVSMIGGLLALNLAGMHFNNIGWLIALSGVIQLASITVRIRMELTDIWRHLIPALLAWAALISISLSIGIDPKSTGMSLLLIAALFVAYTAMTMYLIRFNRHLKDLVDLPLSVKAA